MLLTGSTFRNMVCCWDGTPADSSPIRRTIGISGSTLLCVVQHHIRYRSNRFWIPRRRVPGCKSRLGEQHKTDLQNLNAWTLALVTIALSSLLIWPNATDQALIIV